MCPAIFRNETSSSSALSSLNPHELKPITVSGSVNPFTGCHTRARNDTQAQYCKTPVDNARSDIDRSSSGVVKRLFGNGRNENFRSGCARWHNRDQGTKKKEEDRTIRWCAYSCTYDIYEKETERALGNRSRISETGSETDEKRQLVVHCSRNPPQTSVPRTFPHQMLLYSIK